MDNGRFEALLKGCDGDFRKALAEVADSMFMARVWFDERGVTYTASDLVAFASVVTSRMDPDA